MSDTIYQHTFPNGLTLLADRMEDVRSATFYFLVPAGCVYDPPEKSGTASLLTEMITRGAGKRDHEALMLDLDNLGLDRSESVGTYHISFWGGTLSRNLPACLKIYADILRRPHLPEDGLEPSRSLALQDLISLEDQPGQLLAIQLRKLYLPPPLANDRRGNAAGIKSITHDDLRNYCQRYMQPKGTILSVAGNFEWPSLKSLVEDLFGDWKPNPPDQYSVGTVNEKHAFLEKETTQTWIGLACPSVPIGDPEYYNARGAVSVLSGGMSARLFSEVREKRGLCYSIRASHLTFKDRASVLAFASTTNERAQETLDVTVQELRKLREGVEEEEVERVQAGLKSSLIMQQESTSSRAGSLASDWFYLNRARTLEELQKAIDGLTPKSIQGYLSNYPLDDFSIAVLGPKELKLPASMTKASTAN